MEVLKRDIKHKLKETSHDEMHCSLIDGIRLSCRWAEKDETEEDIVINFTRAETDKIIKLLID